MRWVALFLGCVCASLAIGADLPAPARIDRIVRAYMERERIPGVAVVALQGDRVLIAQGWGFADVASACCDDARRRAADLLDLEAHDGCGRAGTCGGRLAGCAGPCRSPFTEWFADEPQLQLVHLLRHTSGLPEFIGLNGIEAIESGTRANTGLSEVIDIVDRAPRRFAPGMWHSYSNSNYTALALIVERVGRKPFVVQVQERLFARLGAATLEDCATSRARGARWSTGYTQEGKPWTPPANLTATYVGNGGVCASARSLASWMRALAAGRILPSTRVQEMVSTAALPPGFTPPYGYGLSTVTVAGRPAWSHAGGGEGWGAWVAYLPNDDSPWS